MKELNEELLASWFVFYCHQCSHCRNCVVHVIHTSIITQDACQVLAKLGLVLEQVGRALGHLYRTGNYLQLAPPILSKRLLAMQRTLRAQTCPVDEQGVGMLLIGYSQVAVGSS